MVSVMGGNILRGLRRLIAIGLGVSALLGFGAALAQTPSQVIYGPFLVKLPSSSLFNFSGSFSAPASVTGPYLLRVQLSAPNSLTALSFKLNNVQVLSLSDFAGGVTQVDRPVTVLTNNTYSLQVAGKAGTAITITVFATPNLPKPTSLTPNPLSVTVGASGTLTAALSPTPTAAGTLNVSSANTAVATVPASVGFASGQTSVPIPVTTLAVGSAVITASANGGSASATVNVTPAPPTVTSLLPPSLAVTQGASGNLTVTISSAQTADTQVLLATSDANIASVASAVTVPAGQVSAPVPVAGVSPGTAQITASLNGSSASSQITVSPAAPSVVSLVPATSTVSLGASTTLTLTISAAQSTDTLVPLSATPAGIVSIPAQVTVLAGQTTAPVVVGTLALGQAGITASLNGSTASAIVNVVSPPVAVTALEPASFTMNVGATSSFTVTINAAQSTGTEITLTVDNPSVLQIPASVTVALGQTSAVFTATGLAVGNAIITASANGTSKSSSVHVSPQAAAIVSLLPNPLPLQEGATGSLTVAINVAQETDTVIALTSDAPAVAQVAASVTIAAGAISALIPVNALASGTANVTASVNGTSAATVVQVTPPPPVVTSLTPATLTLPKGTPGTLRVTVSRAPNVATAVTLSSSDQAIASVPPSVNIAAGALFADFPVASNAVGQATITASLNGGSATSTVTITAAELTALTLSPQTPTIYAGETQQFTATGTMTDGTSQDFTTRVTWTSFSTAVATINAAGLASALAAGTSTIGASFSFVASATGQNVTVSASTTLTVKQLVALVLTSPTTTLTVGDSTSVTVTSSDPAPAGGLVITLTASGIGSASFPSAASIAAGGTSTTFVLTASAAGDLTLTAAAFERLPGSIAFNIQPRLQINTVTPASGAVESLVTLAGTGFDPSPANNQVAFRGINNTTVPATVQSATATQITVKVPALAESGPITLTNARGTTQSPPFTVTREQDYQLVASPASVIVPQGASSAVQLQLSSTGTKPFTGLATLSAAGLPAGVTAIFAPAATLSAFQTGTATFVASAAAAPGSYPVTLHADAKEAGQVFSRSASVNLVVQAATGVTGVKGRFVTPDNQGIAGIIVRADIAAQPQTVSDAAGNFLLTGLPAGQVSLKMDATPANPLYPIWPYLATLAADQINILPDWTINPPPTADKFVPIANATQDQVVSDARFPGLEIRLPAGVTITGYDGVVKSRIAVEKIMPDKLPVSAPPFPMREAYQLYFGTPMGGIPSAPIPVTLPNVGEFEPGDQAEIWYFDGSPMGGTGEWKVAGLGTVSPDGKTVASNPGVGIPRFCGVCGLMSLSCPPPPAPPPPPPPKCPNCGKPVDLFTGQELMNMNLTSLDGLTPIDLGMTYNPVDAFNGRAGTVASFGFGWVLSYDVAFLPFEGPQKRLVMPGSRFVNFVDDGTGTYRPFDDPNFDGATVRLVDATLNEWELKFKDGFMWRFLPFAAITGKIRGGPPTFLSKMVDPLGNVLNIARQSNGRINSIGSPERNVVMTYGTNGFVSDIRDTANRTMHFTYTPTNRLATVTDADGKVTSLTYVDDTEIAPDPACAPQPTMGERIKTVLFPGRVRVTENFYGSARRVLRQLGHDGREFRIAYKVTGACVTNVSSPGAKCQLGCPEIDSWDNFQAGWRFHGGRVIGVSVTDPSGNISSYGFTSKGMVPTYTDSEGQTTRMKYDSANRPIEITDVLGRTRKLQYDGSGNVMQVVDPLGRITDFTYDGRWNKVTSVTRYLPNNTPVTMQYTYDGFGKRASATDPLGNVTTYAYTPQGQLASVTLPGNRTSTFTSNAAGDLVKVTDPLGNEIAYQTDGAGRLVKVIDALGFDTRTELNGVGQITKVIDALQGETRYVFDTAHRLASVIDPRNNAIESYQYDDQDQLTARVDAFNKATSYEYDFAGRNSRITDRKGQVTTFSYDGRNRLNQTSYAGVTQTLTYDTAGRVVEVREPDNVVTYSYDVADRVVLMRTDTSTGVAEIGYEYDTLDRAVKRTLNGADPTLYTYDKTGRLLTVTYRNEITAYEWDELSRLTVKTLSGGIRQTFQYDDASRLTQLQYLRPDDSVIETIAYTYDAKGQRISKSTGSPSVQETPIVATYDVANRLTNLMISGQTFALAYDENGNLSTKTQQGNPSNVTAYGWDGRNRLTTIAAPGLNAAFAYDPLGRRIAKTINGSTTGYVYDGTQAIAEISNGGGSSALLASLSIDDVIAHYTDLGARTYLTDALGSVIAQAKADHSIQNFYSYTPYGEVSSQGDDEGNPIQYTARENDQTGLYFYRARYYDPVLKRFIAADPIGLSGGLNHYAYVSGMPTLATDPSGLICHYLGEFFLKEDFDFKEEKVDEYITTFPIPGLDWNDMHCHYPLPPLKGPGRRLEYIPPCLPTPYWVDLYNTGVRQYQRRFEWWEDVYVCDPGCNDDGIRRLKKRKNQGDWKLTWDGTHWEWRRRR